MHPLIASRSCEECRLKLFNEKTGRIETKRGVEVLRKGSPVPCETRMGCPKGHYEEQKSLSARNAMAYIHYQECRATGCWPDDSVVRKNARLIRMVEDGAEKREHYKQLEGLGGLATLIGGRK